MKKKIAVAVAALAVGTAATVLLVRRARRLALEPTR